MTESRIDFQFRTLGEQQVINVFNSIKSGLMSSTTLVKRFNGELWEAKLQKMAGLAQTNLMSDALGQSLAKRGSFDFNEQLQMDTTAAAAKRSAQELNKVGATMGDIKKKGDSFRGVMGMPMDQWKEFNKTGNKFNSVGGKMANRIRQVTHGFRGFRMEALGVMFFGMAMQRFFTGLLRPAMQLSGAMELWGNMLAILFLPVALWVIDVLLKFMDILSNNPALASFIRWITVIGVVLGTVLMVLGMFVLGIGSIIMAISSIITPIILAVSAFFTFIFGLISATGWIGKLVAALAVFGIVIPGVSAAAENLGNNQESVWSRIWNAIKSAVSGVLIWLDELWEKFLDLEAVQGFLNMLGLTEEQITMLKNPIQTIKNELGKLWDKAVEKFPALKEITGKTLPEIFEKLETKATKFMDAIGISDAIDSFREFVADNGPLQDLITIMEDLVSLSKDLMGSDLWKIMNKLAGFALDVGSNFTSNLNRDIHRTDDNATFIDVMRETRDGIFELVGINRNKGGVTGNWPSPSLQDPMDVYRVTGG